MLISSWLKSFQKNLQTRPRRIVRRSSSQASRQAEHLETRSLLTAPTLVGVRPNIGDFLDPGEVRDVAPKELTLQFNPGQIIDASNNRLFSNSPIIVERSGNDGTFGDGNEVPVTLGFVGIGDTVEEVVLRFAENLPDDTYRITIRGTGGNPLQNTAGEAYADGADGTFTFGLNLGAQVRAVVPQPIVRGPGGALTQNRRQIVVYFNNDRLNVASAQTAAFYQLIYTNDTVENTDDAGSFYLPTNVSYDPVANTSTLTYAQDLEVLNPGGAGTFRLRIGSNESIPLPPTSQTFVETFVSDFGTAGSATLTLEPIVTIDGNPIDVNFSTAALGAGGVPSVSVAGRQIDIVLNTDGGTTAGQLLWAINLHPEASDLVRATIAGDLVTNFAATATASSFSFMDPGSSFDNNTDLGVLTSQSQVLTGQIRSVDYPFDFPGNTDEIGHRDIDVSEESHIEVAPDSNPQISTLFYNFQRNYGFSPQGAQLSNLITENQKQRAREVFELYSHYLGVQFVETDNLGFTIVTGDLRAIDPNILTGAGGVTAQSSRALNLAIMDNAEGAAWDDSRGGSWFSSAFHEIGHLLGLGHAYDLPDLTVSGAFEGPVVETTTAEPDFPGDADIVHGQLLYRPENRDIDLYRFEVAATGLFSAETVAERLADASLLDTTMRLFREKLDGTRELVSQNDDYFSEDSLISLTLTPGVYFLGVSASGNDAYNPEIADSGMNGTTQGEYRLQISFRPDASSTILDATGVPLDGDLDGLAGGEFNFWFRAATPANTHYVDRIAPNGGTGTLASPFNEIDLALAAASPGDIVRIVGNAGADGDASELADNVAYQIGLDDSGNALRDGGSFEIPQDVVVMIDGGALLKFQDTFIVAGSTSSTVDRSGASVQLLGTPENDVVLTSWRDETVGQDTTPTPTSPNQGNWGGVVFRRDVDNDENRLNYERLGIFMDYIAFANISYGGGKLQIDSVEQVINPVTLFESRPGIYNNFITLSEDSAISADPDSFEETTFVTPFYQNVAFTPDYSRIGPDIYGNTLIDNSTNGLFVRIQTAPGNPTSKLTVTGRFDDKDIVHVIAENLEIQGTPGGPFLELAAPPVVLVTLNASAGGTLGNGDYNYRVVFVDSSGNTSPPSEVTRSVTLAGANGSVTLGNLPPASAPYNGRLLYRSQDTGTGPYELVAILNASSTSYFDDGTTLTGILDETLVGRNRARLDASLVIDPNVIVKLESARIEVGLGAQIIAEGSAGQEIVFTSRLDDRFGAGGTFDTNNDDKVNNEAVPGAGNWGGFYLSPVAAASFDNVLITFGGGIIPTNGDFAAFNVIEAHQADLRVTNSVLEENADGTGGSAPAERFGRSANAAATIFARGTQPILIGNTVRNNAGPFVSINVNALNSTYVADTGRSRGGADLFGGYEDNQGPLIDGNLLGGNGINGMVVRGEVLTTQSVWDDTDIVHVLFDEVIDPNFHTYGGIRLNSDSDASLVVKLQGDDAGFTAGGKPLDIDDRIGGTLQVVGQPFFPVILTSFSDDTVGAGFDLAGLPLTDTNGDGASTGVVGDWRSLEITQYANDRNVGVYNENEVTAAIGAGTNSTARDAEFIGDLGKYNLRTTNPDGTHTIQNTADNNLRLGFEINGSINSPGDVDVYSFTGVAGSEVWIDIDRSTMSLDTVVELITSSGTILALSDNSYAESQGQYPVFARTASSIRANSLNKSQYISDDLYGTNPRDAGMRVILPGVFGGTGTYQIRVRSSNIDSLDPSANRADLLDPAKVFNGITFGSYQLQIRLQETDEVPGSSIVFADIRFATNGIEIYGQPSHSPLSGEYGESTTGNNNSAGAAENVGNILNTDTASVAIAGTISAPTDVDWYRFNVSFDDIQDIPGHTDPNRYASVVFDVDYADGASRGNLQAHVFDGAGRLILTATDSNVSDDRSGPLEGADADDLSRGSFGNLDPFIGPFELPEGDYFLVISSNGTIPSVLDQTTSTNPTSNTIRLEPLTSITRIADETFSGGQGTATPAIYDLYDNEQGQNLTAFHLGDVNLFVSTGRFVRMVDPFTGTVETVLGDVGQAGVHGDIAMRPDGDLFAFEFDGTSDAALNSYIRIDTGTAAFTGVGDDGIQTFNFDAGGNVVQTNASLFTEALTYLGTGTNDGRLVATRRGAYNGTYLPDRNNILYAFNISSGAAVSNGGARTENARAANGAGTDVVELGRIPAAGTVTGLANLPTGLFAVDDLGFLYRINPNNGAILATVNVGLGGIAFEGLAAGPNEVEGGAYATTLFGIDSFGEVFAFNTLGILQPIFTDGQTSIQTGIAGAVGLDFGTLDRNLWATTGNRGLDVGHGTPASPDATRVDVPGGTSLYFGNQRGGAAAGNKNNLTTAPINDYNFPGGAHGSFVSNPFSLEDYSSADKPVLYFNYLLETASNDYIPGVRPMTDSLRAYVGDGTTWSLLATNNSFRDLGALDDEQDFSPTGGPTAAPTTQLYRDVHELYDEAGTPVWRQARLDLSSFAGRDNLRLRFEFATAGSVNVGDITTVGEELYALPGDKLRDGQSYILEGVNQFEFDMGHTLVVPSAKLILEQETFEIQGTLFEFDKNGDGAQRGGIVIAINDDMSPVEIAVLMERAIDNAAITDLKTYRDGNRINLMLEPPMLPIDPNVTLVQSAGAGLQLDGSPGVTPGTTSVVIHSGMSSADVAEVISQRMADHLLPAGVYREAEPNDAPNVFASQNLENVSWTLEANNTITDSTVLPHVSIIGTSSLFTGTDFYRFDVPADGSRVVVDLDGTTPGFNSMIRIVDEMGNMLFENIVGGNLDVASNTIQDAFLDVTLDAGTFFVQVGVPPSLGGALPTARYTMHLSVEGHAVDAGPEPAAALVVDRSIIKGNADLIRVIGHYVTDQGPLGLTTSLPGDGFGGFGASQPSLRGVANNFEGVYIDDIIIGLAERGEMVTGAPANTSFATNQEVNDPFNLNPYQDILEGAYDVEIRRASDYAVGSGAPNAAFRTFGSNDRLTSQQTLFVAPAWNLRDGQTFTLSDGVDTVVFEYEDINVGDGVAQGHFEISFDPYAPSADGGLVGESASVIARRIRDAINSGSVQGILDVSASLADGAADDSTFSASNRVNIYGNAVFTLTDGLQNPGTSTAPEGVSGSVAFIGNTNGSSTLFSFSNTSGLLDPTTGFAERIDTIAIQLPTGQNFDPNPLMGGTGNGPTINPASDFDPLTFTTLDLLNPRIPVFTFNGDFDTLTIAFSPNRGPGFDENDQLIFGLDVDYSPEPINLIGSVVEITFSSGRTVLAEFVIDPSNASIAILRDISEPTVVQFNESYGDTNRTRDQGQILIHSNVISDSEGWGILADAGTRSGAPNPTGAGTLPHAGPVRNLQEINSNRTVPGVVIANNVLSINGTGGILFSGDNAAGVLGAVPFGRIINNTIVGDNSGTGIRVEQNASPTLLNNIVADLTTGILVDGTSQALGTVVGATLYRGNATNANTGIIGLGSFPIQLSATDPLFVDQANRNYYPAPNSMAIDSSLDGLGDRTSMITVRNPLGIGVSPILSPSRDVFGQLRGDDPDVATPASQGANVFKDRGAIDRVDFFQPTAALTDPLDGGVADLDPTINTAWVNLADPVRQFVVSLNDVGIGVDDSSVDLTGAQFKLFTDISGAFTELIADVDYKFVYNSTTNEAIFRAVTVFPFEARYRIEVNNNNATTDGIDGIRDLAGNYLAANETDGTTKFHMLVTDGVNDPPINVAPAYVSMLEDATLVFSTANGRQISVSDADVHLGNNRLQVTLTVSEGVLTLAGATSDTSGVTGLTFSVGDGYNDTTITFEGDVADINNALNGLSYQPPQEYFNLLPTDTPPSSTPVTITMVTSDLGQFTGPPSPTETDTSVIEIDVVSVNDPPTFDPISDPPAVDEDSTAQTIVGFAQNASPGPANENFQTVTFAVGPDITVANTGNIAFTSGPSVDASGTLTYEVAPNTNGTATFLLTAVDSDGATSAPQQFTITVNAINDEPVFTLATTSVTSDEDEGAVGPFNLVATSAAGPATATDELAGQVTTFRSDAVPLVTTGNLVFTSFNVSATGTLTYEVAPNTSGTATFNMWLTDDGSTANADDDNITDPVLITINVTAIADPPVPYSPNYVIDAGDALVLDGSGSTDVDFGSGVAEGLTYEWDLNNDGTTDVTGVNPTVAYATLTGLGLAVPGTSTIGLKVTDTFSGTTVGTTATIDILTVDFGDAPNSYGTLKASNGAAHTIVPGFYLGASVDSELDGSADDGTDEDGIVFDAGMQADTVLNIPSYFTATASAAGKLDVWLDFNNNGVFETSEHLNNGTSFDVVAGDNTFSFVIPAGAAVTNVNTSARARLSTAGSLAPTGRANDGEVEDYVLQISPLLDAVAVKRVLPMFSQTSDLTPLLQWAQADGTLPGSNSSYNITLLNSLNQVVGFEENFTGTSLEISDPLPAGTYTIQVQSFNRAGTAGPVTNLGQFEVVAMTVTSPSGTLPNGFPTVTWTPVTDSTDHYELQIVSAITGLTVVSETNLSAGSTSYTVATQLPIDSYRVRVRAIETTTNQPGDWSPYQNFTVATAPVLQSPTGTVNTPRPILTWTAIPGAFTYDVRIVDLTDNIVPIQSLTGLTTTSYQLTTPLELGEYSIEVRAVTSQNAAANWSTPVVILVGVPTVISQPSGRLQDSTPTIAWSAVAGAENYDVIIVDKRTNTIVHQVSGRTTLQYTVPDANALPLGNYEIQVRANNLPAAGSTRSTASVTSVATPFTVSTPPVVTGPDVGIYDTTPTVTFTTPVGTVTSELEFLDGSGNAVFRDVNGNPITITGINGNSYTVPNNQPLPPGQYRVRVRSYGNAGTGSTVVSDWSIPQFFQVGTAPNLLGPAAGIGSAPFRKTNDATPSLTWNGSVAGETYNVWVSSLSTGVTVQTVYDLNAQSFETKSLPNGQYRYWVQANNGLGEKSAWSKSFDFQITTAPVVAELGPSFTDPTVRWQPPANTPASQVAYYQIWFNKIDVTPNVKYVVETNLTATEYLTANPFPDGRYKVWTRAYVTGTVAGAPVVESSFSNGVVFEVGGRPAFNVVGDTSDDTPLLTWSAVTGAVRYEIFLASSAAPSTPLVRVSDLTVPRFQVTTALPAGGYIAWVRAINATGKRSPWSLTSEGRFTVNAASRPVINAIPTSSDSTPTITWSPAAGADHYDIYISTAANTATALIRNQNVAGTTYTPSVSLPVGNFRVWVRAISAGGTAGPWSTAVSFTIVSNDIKSIEVDNITMLASLGALAAPLDPAEVTVSLIPSRIVSDAGRQIAEHQSSVATVEDATEANVQQLPVQETTAAQSIADDGSDDVMANWDAAIWAEESAATANVAVVDSVSPESAANKSEKQSFGWLAGLAMLPPALRRRRKSED